MNTDEIDDIRRQMALIRRDIHVDVSDVVDVVGEAFDWRAPIRNHPYVALGAGLLAGYLLVPRKKTATPPARRAAPAVLAAAANGAIPRSLAARAEPPRAAKAEPSKPAGRRLLGWVGGMIWPLVNQSIQSYAAMWLEDQIKQQMNPDRRPPEEPAPPSSAERSAGPYPYDVAPVRIARWG